MCYIACSKRITHGYPTQHHSDTKRRLIATDKSNKERLLRLVAGCSTLYTGVPTKHVSHLLTAAPLSHTFTRFGPKSIRATIGQPTPGNVPIRINGPQHVTAWTPFSYSAVAGPTSSGTRNSTVPPWAQIGSPGISTFCAPGSRSCPRACGGT